MGAGQDGPCAQADGRPRRRHGGGPAGPRACRRARRQRLAGASIPAPGAGLLCHRRLRPGGRAAPAERGGCGPGVGPAQYRHAHRVPGVAGADLERDRDIRRGPAPRGGGAPPRHAGKAEGPHRSLPTAASATCTSPKGTWSTPSGCWSKVWPSVVPPATGLVFRKRSRRAWAMPLRSRGASRRGVHCWRRRSAKVSTRARRWQSFPRVAQLSEVCRLAGCGEEAGQHARQALDLAQQQQGPRQRGACAAPAWRCPCPRRPPRCRSGRSPLPAGPGPGEELGMRPLVAHCHLGLGQLYGQTGRASRLTPP